MTGDHSVHFYRDVPHIVEFLHVYVTTGVLLGESVIVVAAGETLARLKLSLARANMEDSKEGQVTFLDADDTVDRLVIGQRIDEVQFNRVIASLLAEKIDQFGSIRVYGDMVNRLYGRGAPQLASDLERLWNKAISGLPVRLACGYELAHFAREDQTHAFETICNLHSHVVPSQSYVNKAAESDWLATIARLEQKNLALENSLKALQKTKSSQPVSKEKRAGTFDPPDSAETKLYHTLSSREKSIFAEIGSGKSLKEIAGDLNVSVKTVSTYRSRIFKKMSYSTNAEIIRMYQCSRCNLRCDENSPDFASLAHKVG